MELPINVSEPVSASITRVDIGISHIIAIEDFIVYKWLTFGSS
jgi:hypothetical protein